MTYVPPIGSDVSVDLADCGGGAGGGEVPTYTSLDDFSLDLETVDVDYGTQIKDFGLELSTWSYGLDDFALELMTENGVLLTDFALDLQTDDSTMLSDFSLELWVSSTTPSFKSTLAQRLSSVISRVN